MKNEIKGSINYCIADEKHIIYDMSTIKEFNSIEELRYFIKMFYFNRFYMLCHHHRSENWNYHKFTYGVETLVFESIFNPNHKVILEYESY